MQHDHTHSSATAQITRRGDYRPSAYLVDALELEFALDQAQTLVRSEFVVYPNPQHSGELPPLQLDGEQLTLRSVRVNGELLQPAQYEQTDRVLRLGVLPESARIQIEVAIQPETNTALEGLYVSGDFLLTQCEAEGFRRITYFLDRPDVMCRYRVVMLADGKRFPVLLSNGNQVAAEQLADGRLRVVWDDPFPKPSYLFALVAGDLACVERVYSIAEGSGDERRVALKFYVEHGSEDQCEHAMASLQRAMRWDEQRFGLHYDLDVYHVVVTHDFNMGAMENKSLNIFNSRYVLADRETATDADFSAVEAVIGHEYFHNWTGNRVTCRDWFQLTLKEGLTVFRDQEFSADMQSRAVKRIQDVRALREYQFAEDAGPMAHPIRPDAYQEINNFYTATVYQKGAEVIRMLHSMLGEQGFQQGMRLYFQRHDGQAVTCDDFVAAMADANDVDLQSFFRWYSTAGTPQLQVTLSHDRQQRSCRLQLRQQLPQVAGQQAAPLPIPIRLALFDRAGAKIPAQVPAADNVSRDDQGDLLIMFDRAQQELVLEQVDSPPVPSILRGLSAPVRLQYDYAREDLACLMQHDDDAVNRYDAAERLQLTVLDDLYQALADRPDDGVVDTAQPQLDPQYLQAMAAVINDRDSDPALLAQLLSLVSEDYFSRRYEQVDIDRIHQARSLLGQQVAHALGGQMLARMQQLQTPAAWSLSATAMATRSLRNTLQSWLMFSQDEAMAERVYASYNDADNMTDRMAALAQLVWHRSVHAHAALQDFATRYQNYPLVMDKWFAVQAMSTGLSIAELEQLLQHPAYNERNPNKVRAVLGSFSAANLTSFHAADGSGYAFVADQLAAQDRLNPQLAARLANCFSRWRAFDPQRRELMQAQLEKLQQRPDGSTALGEMLERLLA
ncbi:MAG: aminopeptidase N [Gammaproteobacteria bacterium]|nr:aminopeptidase N [Gammaproteobacteria bacterium]